MPSKGRKADLLGARLPGDHTRYDTCCLPINQLVFFPFGDATPIHLSQGFTQANMYTKVSNP